MMDDIKALREKTGAGIMDAKKALLEANGVMAEAEKILREKGLVKAEKKAERNTGSGRVFCYTHVTGKVGAMIEMACETDFVAENEEFAKLCKEIAMQVASMEPKNLEELLAMEYIRDGSKKVDDLVKELIAKTGENMRIVRFVRYELGEESSI